MSETYTADGDSIEKQRQLLDHIVQRLTDRVIPLDAVGEVATELRHLLREIADVRSGRSQLISPQNLIGLRKL